MANFLYDKAREKFLNGELSWRDDRFQVILIGSGYNANQSEDELLSSIATTLQIARSGDLQNKSSVDGSAKASDIDIESVPNKVIKSLVVIKLNPSNLQQSILIAHIDTAGGIGGTGLTPTTTTVKIEWKKANDGSGTVGEIFRL